MDKVSTFAIQFNGDAGDLIRVFGSIKDQARSAAADIEATTSRVELFKGTQQQTELLGRTIGDLSVKAAGFRQQLLDLDGAGIKAPKDLTDALKATERQLATTSKQFDAQSAILGRLDSQLKSQGVNTSNLAAEEARLASALNAANTAATNQAAQQALGLTTLRQITPEISKLYAAYNTLSVSGTLSAKEQIIAQQLLGTKVAELRGQVTGLAVDAKAGGPDLIGMFAGSVLPALGLTAGVAGVVQGIRSAIDAAKEFREGLAEIGAVTNISQDDLDLLGAAARSLSTSIGVDVNQALSGMKELLRSGVPQDNVLEIARLSAIAAKAGVASFADGVKASRVVIDAFGVDLGHVGNALDAVLVGAKNGGPTLQEFADSAAPLGNVVKANNVDFNEAVAVLAVMTHALGNAGEASTALARIIQQMNTADAREKLRALGIEGNSLIGTFRAIGDRGLDLEQVLSLGLGSTKAAAALAAITTNAKDLPGVLDAVGKSAGTAAEGLRLLYNTPKQAGARFDAEVQDARINLGKFFGDTLLLTRAGGQLVREFNEIPATFREADRAFKDSGGSIAAYVKALAAIDPLATEAARAQQRFGAAAGDTADKNDRLNASFEKANVSLRGLAPQLAAAVQALQQAGARDISDLETRAQAQIAALDRTVAAQADRAAKTLAIENKLATDRLAVITKEEADIKAATDAAITAREATERSLGKKEADIAQATAQQRLASLAFVLTQYQAHYNALISQQQAFAQKADSIEQSRAGLQRSIAEEVRQIDLAQLSGLDQFVARNAEIDRLIGEGRKAAALGEIEQAKGYFEQAITESKGLTTVINADGVTIITALQARTAKTEALKKISNEVNASFGDQGDAAKKGSEATAIAIDKVKEKLTPLQEQYDALKKSVGEGLAVSVNLDETAVAAAFKTLDQLSQDRHVKLIVDEVGGTAAPGAPPIGPSGQPLARGGFAGLPIGANPLALPVFGAGGRVPGIGNADTVPARLEAGSFVVRKAAAAVYGDALMEKVARYAAGGPVTKDDVRKWAVGKWGYDPFAGGTDTGGFKPSWGYDPFAPPPPKQAAAPQAPETGYGMNDRSSGVAPPPLPDPGTAAPKPPDTGPYKYKSGDSFQRDLPAPINFDVRPVPDALMTAANVIEYAREMLNSVGSANPMLVQLAPQIEAEIATVQNDPLNKSALTRLLQAAETIGTNPYLFAMWGKTSSAKGDFKPEWFVDWLQQRGLVDKAGKVGVTGSSPIPVGPFAARFFSGALPKLGNPLTTGSRNPLTGRPFAAGGSTDSVPALLTPGEWVVQRSRAQQLGPSIMHAINSISIAPSVLAGMLSGGSAPRGYQFGGEVGAPARFDAPERGSSANGSGMTVNFHLDSSDLLSEEHVRRKVLPVLDRIMKRSR